MIRRSLWIVLLGALAGCTCAGGPEVPATKVAGPGAPNVLLVVWDTVRADHLSAYGYDRPTSPRLAALAEEGVLYERAVSPGMWTVPSHASLFTGVPVRTHGTDAQHKWLDHRFTTLAEHFGGHGYDTWLFSANPYLSTHTNLTQGFDEVEHPWSPRWKAAAREATMGKLLPEDASNTLAPRWVPTIYPTGRSKDRVKDAGPVAADALLAWLGGRSDTSRPWLATLNYMEAHVPRVPSRASREALFDASRIHQQLTLDQSFGNLLAYTLGKHAYTAEEIEVIASTYDAAVRDVDAALGVLLDRLEGQGLLDDTIVVVTSDHGEHLGEHHRIGHKFSVYAPLVRVPLVVRWPKGLPPARVAQVVSTLAVPNTVADLAGLPPLPDATLGSLRALDAQPDEAFSELLHATPQALERVGKIHPELDWAPWLRTYQAVEVVDAKCIERSDDARELYALPDDPLETQDLSATDPERAATVCGRLEAWRGRVPPYDPGLAGPDDNPTLALDAATRARLEVLGYLDDKADPEAAP
ncbi:MAG: sulfatase [Alphaproteobacteria bacterium]|nr:sulfatase [Alphaproteobacteria bacterium]